MWSQDFGTSSQGIILEENSRTSLSEILSYDSEVFAVTPIESDVVFSGLDNIPDVLDSLAVDGLTYQFVVNSNTTYPQALGVGDTRLWVVTDWQQRATGVIFNKYERLLQLVKYYEEGNGLLEEKNSLLSTSQASQSSSIEILSRMNERTSEKSLEYYKLTSEDVDDINLYITEDRAKLKKSNKLWRTTTLVLGAAVVAQAIILSNK